MGSGVLMGGQPSTREFAIITPLQFTEAAVAAPVDAHKSANSRLHESQRQPTIPPTVSKSDKRSPLSDRTSSPDRRSGHGTFRLAAIRPPQADSRSGRRAKPCQVFPLVTSTSGTRRTIDALRWTWMGNRVITTRRLSVVQQCSIFLVAVATTTFAAPTTKHQVTPARHQPSSLAEVLYAIAKDPRGSPHLAHDGTLRSFAADGSVIDSRAVDIAKAPRPLTRSADERAPDSVNTDGAAARHRA
ncbi:hypothetical protein B0J13DRAFT_635690 [Dactylonectria estremocensis]|uniref:Uncharacterized protein n=1 Tax=Dactylonectria estremocensis TaxID=1079267 RepID=A0A9P9EUD4_9HYPO|nr:hypothetical protein B0J13DRAFT_635690 [Dactylonectria estremocensis]